MIASILSLILTFLVEGFIQDAVIVNARGRSFLIDTAGQIVTKQDYSQIEDCADGLYRAVDRKTGKWGGIDMAEKDGDVFVFNGKGRAFEQNKSIQIMNHQYYV